MVLLALGFGTKCGHRRNESNELKLRFNNTVRKGSRLASALISELQGYRELFVEGTLVVPWC